MVSTKWWVGATAAFASEIALLIAVGFAVSLLLQPGRWAVPAGWGAVLVVIVIWSQLMAPRSPRRLAVRGRVVLGCVLFLAVGALLAMSTLWAGIALAVIGGVITVVAQPSIEHDDVFSRS